MNKKKEATNMYRVPSALNYLILILCAIILGVYLQCLVWGSPQQESEPNNRREEANEIRLGETIERLFHIKSDSDWYTITIPASVRVTEGTYTLRLIIEPESIEESITVKPVVKSSFLLTKEDEKWVIKENDF